MGENVKSRKPACDKTCFIVVFEGDFIPYAVDEACHVIDADCEIYRFRAVAVRTAVRNWPGGYVCLVYVEDNSTEKEQGLRQCLRDLNNVDPSFPVIGFALETKEMSRSDREGLLFESGVCYIANSLVALVERLRVALPARVVPLLASTTQEDSLKPAPSIPNESA